MSAEDFGRATASTDCCRTAPQAGTHEAQRLRIDIVMNLIHGGIFATRDTHSIKHGFPYPDEISPAIVQFPQNIDQGGIIL
jgi:hypothetical protein